MLRSNKKYYLAFTDLSITLCSMVIAFLVMSSMKQYFFTELHFYPILYLALFLPVTFFVYDKNKLYTIKVVVNKNKHMAAIFKALLTIIFLFAVLTYFLIPNNIYMVSLIILVFAFCLLLLNSVFRMEMVNNKSRTLLSTKRILVLGSEELRNMLSDSVLKKNGYVFVKSDLKDLDNLNYLLNHFENLEYFLLEYKITDLIISFNNVKYSDVFDFIDRIKPFNVNVKLSSDMFKIFYDKTKVEKFGIIYTADITSKVINKNSLKLKRIIDLILSSMGIIILSPFFIIVSLIIKLSSKGPVIFNQTRIGKDGKPFHFYKFRSMYVIDGEDEGRKQQMIEFMKNNCQSETDTKVIDETRVTAIGKFLRKTSLDELPQLFNVLKGEMSLVGPRPCLPYEYENYEEWHKIRSRVLPGCTGVWQVSGRSTVSFLDSILLDLYYVNKMSPVLDIKIILKTIPVMFFSKGGK